MSDEPRRYRCLCCPERPVFLGKLRAHLHINEEHRDLLDQHHIEELLEQMSLPRDDKPLSAPHTPPYRCRYCSDVTNALQLDTVYSHLKFKHDIERENARYLRDFVSRDDFEREQAELRSAEARELRSFEQRLDSICGVGDFLTECGA